jgi:hypothetical protein
MRTSDQAVQELKVAMLREMDSRRYESEREYVG